MSNIILAIDTSMNYCSVAVYKKKIYSLSDYCNKEHTIKILPMIKKILLLAKITFKDINYVIFSKGPGNFTGIRIAIGVAQSLSLSLNIPILGISTLAIMAEKAWRKYHQKKILVAIAAGIDKIYLSKYIKDSRLLWIGNKTEVLIHSDDIKEETKNLDNDWFFVGNGLEKFNSKNFFNYEKIKNISPNAKDLIPFSLLNIKNKNFLHFTKLEPNYLNNIF
ncbi:tRNA (adenosine(37)-N6)-threonylcarbamoyltransferase complex dimerization subunit type 1 TsaB [Buchnera aphidicola]|uniref:tRNA threonylcarbamoyladenosine biosynthesis protein TsaB n=1 Tax=Buchnera aphidicola (Aphis gossypii) TaxID=98785 RepID=A0A5J6Z9S3_9GAMM|nr:tRNA (adenosine(37)-N6)-threonylcarbamoyltransferase complex dimerization subunit type 1 TsaB [Buchnera aphidicola]QFQ32152.1 tRNA (adenosine(37)-N6)-threonylcarbamoyltransferase complex dimerization subunit type 1 TsaB [Buchnera aphidicola (Aphis gossypii)]UPT14678.1 tRNA (adenosine(37)-N6)-threonylcarbamoyltransferase complex dimerization subunit type 1 TsaB [Buchnera aphidicola (Aphis gossypii)]